MATWATLLAQIRRDLEETTASVWSDTSLLWHANEAARDIATRTKCSRDWQYTTTIASQMSYDLPDRTLEIIAVYYDNNLILRMEFSDFIEQPQVAETGTPTYYIIDDANLILYPTPTEAKELAILRYTFPADLTSTTDAMPFESRYDAAIANYVKAKAWEQIADWESADKMLERYEHEIGKIRSQEGKQSSAMYSHAPREVY